MKIYQGAILSRDPAAPLEAVTKQYVDAQFTSGGMAPVFITDISPSSTGSVGGKTYVAGTVPVNKVILTGNTNTSNVRVTIVAEGPGNFYSPTVTITTDTGVVMSPVSGVVTLTEDANDKRYFTGTIDLIGVVSNTVVTAKSSTGSEVSAVINVAAAGPVFSSLTLGNNPGAQTELKSGDTISVTGIVANSAVSAETVAGGVVDTVQQLTVGAINSAGVGFKTVTGNISIGTGAGSGLVLSVRAKDALPTWGAVFSSTNNKTLNQSSPVIGTVTITYPASQTAIKNAETATVNATITLASGTLAVNYTATNGDLSVTLPTDYATSKTVTRIGGSYSYGTNNYLISATRVENNKTVTSTAAVTIANVAAMCTMSYGAARILSSAGGNNTSISFTSNQNLAGAPAGSIVGTSGVITNAWSGSGTSFTNFINVKDTDAKGVQTLSSVVTFVGRSGIPVVLANTSYTIGGFINRTITVPAFQQLVFIGTSVTTISKTIVSYTGSSLLTLYNDTGDHFQGYSIANGSGNYAPTGSYLWLSDAAFAGSNTSGLLQIDIQETV